MGGRGELREGEGRRKLELRNSEVKLMLVVGG